MIVCFVEVEDNDDDFKGGLGEDKDFCDCK